jgi:hypothetical protein
MDAVKVIARRISSESDKVAGEDDDKMTSD